MASDVPVPPRLTVILAREASKAVVLRRGPTDWSRLSLWDTDTDQVEHGQWLHARLYPDRCDLSPDGSLFVYFCFHDRSSYHRTDDGYSYAYTAISHPPYFTALALWNAFDTWGGGGVFADNWRVYIRAGEAHPQHPLANPMQRIEIGSLNAAEHETLRMGAQRGWQPSDPEAIKKRTRDRAFTYLPVVYFRERADGAYRLERTWEITAAMIGVGLYTVQKRGTDEKVLIDGDLTWADWDQRGRLACADKGALYLLDPADPNGSRTLIADFNGQTFERIIAPEWASKW